jgi:hypothetical protein
MLTFYGMADKGIEMNLMGSILWSKGIPYIGKIPWVIILQHFYEFPSIQRGYQVCYICVCIYVTLTLEPRSYTSPTGHTSSQPYRSKLVFFVLTNKLDWWWGKMINTKIAFATSDPMLSVLKNIFLGFQQKYENKHAHTYINIPKVW